jgi:hypothetical protein
MPAVTDPTRPDFLTQPQWSVLTYSYDLNNRVVSVYGMNPKTIEMLKQREMVMEQLICLTDVHREPMLAKLDAYVRTAKGALASGDWKAALKYLKSAEVYDKDLRATHLVLTDKAVAAIEASRA